MARTLAAPIGALLLLLSAAGSLAFVCTPVPGLRPRSCLSAPPRRLAALGEGARCTEGHRGLVLCGSVSGAGPLGLDFDTQEELLNAAYAGAGKDGFCTTEEEDAAIDAVAGPFASTYGEITAAGLRALFSDIGVSEDETFYDLGSGVGRAVLQAHLRGIRRCVGIELARSRHRVALRVVQLLEQEMKQRGIPCSLKPLPLLSVIEEPVGGVGGDCGGGVWLQRGDITKTDISDANVIYLSSLCFAENFMAVLADKLSSEAPSLRVVATLQRFPAGLAHFKLQEPVCEYGMSWSTAPGGGSPVFVYVRDQI